MGGLHFNGLAGAPRVCVASAVQSRLHWGFEWDPVVFLWRPSAPPGCVCFISYRCVGGVFEGGCTLCAFRGAVEMTALGPPVTGRYLHLKCSVTAWKQVGFFCSRVPGSVTGVMPDVPWAQGRTTVTCLWHAVVWEAWRCWRAAKVRCKVAEQTTYNKLAVPFCATSPPPFLQSSFLLPSWHMPIQIVPFARGSFPKLYSGSLSPFACRLDSPFHFCLPVAQHDALPVKKASVLPSVRLLCLSCCCCLLGKDFQELSRCGQPDVQTPEHLNARHRSPFAQKSISHLSGLWWCAVVLE